MEVGLVQKIDIDHEMQQAYLDYAMSVIVSRALPDARDGLKPVHRRILYAMYDMGLRADSPYKKSARIVGEVLGKYHPHGDMAVYDAMARMAQDFSMRVLLVDGQGNFGSIDGDPPAAMRYTEARLASAAFHMLTDIGKNTVDFDANFDETLYEPTVLPAAIPNLLVNGASGIAVGMSTSIPPHNLGEVVDALRYLLDHWERMDDISLEDLMRFIQGPDFPTGGVIIQQAKEETLASAYGTGRGRVTVQAQAHLEEMERGRNRIIVNELPYLTNKASLIERIAELVREERLVGIADLRDESDRHGMRIVIELTKTADPQELLKDLYKHTPMQSTFSIIMLALVDGEPRLLSLKQALRVYLDHRIEVIRRRSEYELEKARQRAHILEGLRIALKNLDEVIALIRQAPDAETARVRLMRRFKLTEIQAQAILDMQLRRLASLERKKIEIEYKELLAQIKELETLLRSPKKMRQVVSDELQGVKESFGERRRTQIVMLKAGENPAPLTASELAPDQSMWLIVTPDGLASRVPEEKTPRQSGSDAPGWLLKVNTRDTLYLVSESGEAAAVAMQAVPEIDKPASGTHYSKFSALKDHAPLGGLFTLPPKSERPEDWFVLSVTRQGMVKKTSLAELPGPSANSFLLTRVNEGDRLGWLRLTNGQREILLQSAIGMAIRFSEVEVRPMGLGTAGVSGMKLQSGDLLAGMELIPDSGEIFMIASDGSAKRVAVNQFPTQGRYGQGVVAWKLPAKVHVIGIGAGKGTTRVTLYLEKLAAKMVRMDAAPLQGRTARGKVIQEVKSGDHLLRLVVPWEVEKMTRIKKEKIPAAQKRSTPAQKKAPPAAPPVKRRASVNKEVVPAARKRATTAEKKAPPAAPPVKRRASVSEEKVPTARKRSTSVAKKAPPAATPGKQRPTASKAGAGTKTGVPAPKKTPTRKPASSSKSPKPASSSQRKTSTRTKKTT